MSSVPTATTPTVALANVNGSTAGYNYVKSMLVDQYGRVTSATSGNKPIVSVVGTTGQALASIDGSTDTATVGLATVPSVAGTYKNPSAVWWMPTEESPAQHHAMSRSTATRPT